MLTRLASVDSTMELAHAAALAGAPHGSAFVAERQHVGRGSRGRPWESQRGGLWLSVIARPARADAFAALSLRVGLAIAEAIEATWPAMPTLQVKWPNDLQAEGRKVAGVLCEASWSGAECRWVVVGVGVNVCNPLPATLSGQAARCDEWVPGAEPDELLDRVLPAVTRVSGYAGPLTDPELAAFLRRDALAGRRARAPVAGVVIGIAADGSLLVRDPGGQARPVLAGLVLDPA
ncbi:MAG: biotin--[acetyl-CoA-carboxylase] ligase [Gemmatimonadales bacterium]|jgi:BirA family biotin operon repressor/biotin-[acetyl-CoA-carboxylase] ligase|nr:biotin--[acetyl-CoA-carboxylase] ligase [Gemmatimonadales bacterium]MBP6570977.1 biotin--[acetyl-CoA-carboxylase] ligase [Gemmatimonadales bacterium]MBP7619957.1 biotin--[acetyl-CoA-carboxylase] ligase [Gemmatimonadales bacterium]MBP9899225.1 biotin--[acetyl-CoA-carboxylase] ligase [Gemmatimonadales bacterium]